MRFTILGGIMLIALAAAAEAKVYKWVDAEGRVHYSSRAPAQTQATEVRVAPAPPSAREPAEPGAPAQPAAENDAAREADAARAEAFRKNCEIARQNLAVLEDPANRRFNEEGEDEPIYYTDEQREEKIAQARKSIETYCDGPKGGAAKK